MGRQKQWHLAEDSDSGIYVKYDGFVKRPDSDEALGGILDINQPKIGKYSNKGIVVSESSYMYEYS